MLDIRLFREQPDVVREGFAKVGRDPGLVDQVLDLDVKRREAITEVERLKAERNAGSKDVARTKDKAERDAKIAAMKLVGDQISELDAQANAIDLELHNLMLDLPNLPLPEVPVGKDEHDNVVVRVEGEIKEADFAVKPHWELGEELGILDFERGVRMSGTRFFVMKGLGVRLQRALISWMIDMHVDQHGYTELAVPYLVKADAMVGTGNLPKFADTIFHIEDTDLWLIPTAEVPVTNLHREEILDKAQLPLRYVAHTPCFRNEQMSAGRDVRGIKRLYQFDKVEMVKLVEPATSYDELFSLISNAEDVCKGLNIPYRLLQLCTADLGTATIKYDLEMWAPGMNEWLEVSSCGLFGDYQSRRANIRYRPEAGAKPEFVHTLNGSGLALPRVIISILENYQNADGSVTIPEVLRPYMGGIERIIKSKA
ncbi:serine--tRNA ligase [Herpetosiphon geysericola]|uniref:Serine--tRNA ligase n=1 Tax=Herpetosiphon geysericola TaxID=70996 RepID=A0A0P6Y510_9CHLR|nr:serine--tRNA ligase [Herpetosiphon geysericola]KPL91305.1 seryl-tRNA synthetase [Herpetosiphon geysericola]